MARPSVVYRCPGRHLHRPVLGVFDGEGTLRVLKRDLKLTIREGVILLGCRDCRFEQVLVLPLAENSLSALVNLSQRAVG